MQFLRKGLAMALSVRTFVVILVMAAMAAFAMSQRPQRRNIRQAHADTIAIKAQPLIADDDTIPDSLLHPRWRIQRTLPITLDDLNQGAADLQRPDNMKQQVEYDDSLGQYVVGQKIGGTYIAAPVVMTAQEYMQWSERQLMRNFFRKMNDEIYQAKG